ncbi:hypothetical protein MNBD_GAMMA25-1032 [hydrothermal vent metagenome]|uniref:Uncharacterized protein n=1 Tax=hydrothermal vent metagenome TaxID=652676 RepID=A0A3B1BB46_9ZZZZ
MSLFEAIVPYLPLLIVIGWGLYQMFSKILRRFFK